MIKNSPHEGYCLKEAQITVTQLVYVDDHTVVSKTPEGAQGIIDTLDSYLTWSHCLRAKPSKCRALAFKVFKGDNVQKNGFQSYNPNLKISGTAIPYLGEEPFKFLGRKITATKSGQERWEIEICLKSNLERTEKCNLTGPMKLWLYNNFIVSYITWFFTIYDLPLSFAKKLQAMATVFLKKWTGLTKTITNSVLYRQKDHFGLGLTDLVTHFKKMQVCRMHILKYSQDEVSRKIYTHIYNKNKPKLNKLGIPEKVKVWKPSNCLEKAERDIHLDKISLGNPCFGKRFSNNRVKDQRHTILKRVEQDEEELRLANCYSYGIQGDWLNFDMVVKTDLSWNSLIYTLPQELLKFLLNSTHNVLPTPDNLKRWGKTVTEIECSLCGGKNITLKHILNSCPTALHQGRFTWRHDNILNCMAKYISSMLKLFNAKKPQNLTVEDKFINFIKEGGKKKKSKTKPAVGLLCTANDWEFCYDCTNEPLIFPIHIAQTSLRPDMVIYSNLTRQVILIELTVPIEDNILQRHRDKESKYNKLIDDIKINQWNAYIFAVEVGSRGYIAKSLLAAFSRLGMSKSEKKKITKDISQVCVRSSYTIYLSRKNNIWRPWETSHPIKSKCHLDFQGFTSSEIKDYKEINNKRIDILKFQGGVDFQGFTSSKIEDYKEINNKRIDILKSQSSVDASSHCFNESELNAPGIMNNTRTEILNSLQNQNPTSIRGGMRRRVVTGPLKFRQNHITRKNTINTGLKNLGNTCYMNSIIQCLYSVKSFKGKLYEDLSEVNLNPNSRFQGEIVKEIGATFGLMSENCGGSVSLSRLKSVVDRVYVPFRGSSQQDSHEFLMKILEWIAEDLGASALTSSPGHSEGDPPCEADGALGMSDCGNSFLGFNQSLIKCGRCSYSSTTFEPFSAISLPLAAGGLTLEDLLHSYYGETSLQYECPKCKCTVTASRKLSVRRLPSVLIFHLNRFEGRDGLRKNQSYVRFPLKGLDMSGFGVDQAPKMCLTAVSNHYGTMNGGHYTAYGRREGGWYNFNDLKVARIPEHSVCSAAAYVLFYEM